MKKKYLGTMNWYLELESALLYQDVLDPEQNVPIYHWCGYLKWTFNVNRRRIFCVRKDYLNID